MKETDYYKEITNLIENYEVNTRVRAMQDNHDKLMTNWKIGKLLVEAQGGKNRAKYGEYLIKKWSINLETKYGKSYSKRSLMFYRKLYEVFPNVSTAWTQLSYSHLKNLLFIKSENARNYYVNQVILNHLSVRELREMIKSNAFERLSYADKENIQLIDDNAHLIIEDMIKDPILIKVNKQVEKLDEKALHKYIISMLEERFLELGTGFTLAGHEYKVHIDNHIFKIDLLFFNYQLNSFVVVEVKIREYHPKDIGQLKFYVDYVDKNIKLSNHNKIIGILIVRKKNKYVVEYVTDEELFVTTYKLML